MVGRAGRSTSVRDAAGVVAGAQGVLAVPVGKLHQVQHLNGAPDLQIHLPPAVALGRAVGAEVGASGVHQRGHAALCEHGAAVAAGVEAAHIDAAAGVLLEAFLGGRADGPQPLAVGRVLIGRVVKFGDVDHRVVGGFVEAGVRVGHQVAAHHVVALDVLPGRDGVKRRGAAAGQVGGRCRVGEAGRQALAGQRGAAAAVVPLHAVGTVRGGRRGRVAGRFEFRRVGGVGLDAGKRRGPAVEGVALPGAGGRLAAVGRRGALLHILLRVQRAAAVLRGPHKGGRVGRDVAGRVGRVAGHCGGRRRPALGCLPVVGGHGLAPGRRRAVGQGVGPQRAVVGVLPGDGVRAHRAAIGRIDRAVLHHVGGRVGLGRLRVHLTVPAHKGIAVLRRGSPARSAGRGFLRHAVDAGHGFQRAAAVIALVGQCAAGVVRDHLQIGVILFGRQDRRQLRAGQGADVDGALYLGGVHIVAALIQAAHGVQLGDDGQDFRRGGRLPRHADQAHTGCRGDGVQDGQHVHGCAHILQPKGGNVRVGGHRQVGDGRLVADRQVRDRGRQVQHPQLAAVGQLHAGDGRAVKIHVFDADAAVDVHALHVAGAQAGTAPHVQRAQQGVIAQVQLLQVAVVIAGPAVAQLDAAQLRGHAKVGKAHLQAAEVAHAGQLTGRIDINFGVVHVVQRAHQCVGRIAHAPRLHQVAAVFHTGINVGVGRHGHVGLGIAAQLDHVGKRVAGVVLAVHVAETVVQPPLALFGLAALEHGQVCAAAVLDQGGQVLKPGVLVKDGLAPFGLVLLKGGFHPAVGQHAGAAQGLIHGLDFAGEGVAQVAPHHALLAVEHVRAARQGVGVLQAVAEYQRALVIDAQGGVKVIGQPAPLARAHQGREGVLCPAVHHQEQLGEDVIEHGALQLQVLGGLCPEFRQPVGRVVRGVDRAVRVGVALRQRVARGRGPVGALQPCRQGLKPGGVLIGRVGVGVAGLEVVQPSAAAVVVALPQHAVAGVVPDLPGFVPILKAENFLRALVVIEVVLAQESGGRAVRPKDHAGEAVDALAHRLVFHLRGRLEGAGVIVQNRQLHVVRALAAGHVGLHAEGVRGNRRRPQRVLAGPRAVVQQEAALVFHLVVFAGVVLRGCALHVDLHVFRGEALAGRHGVHIGHGAGLFIPLVLRQLRALDDHIGQAARQVGDHDVAIGVVDVIAVVTLDQVVHVLAVRDPVVQHLVPGQVIVIDPDAVQVHRAAVRPDADAHGRGLLEVVAGRVLHHAGHDAVHIDKDQPVFAALLHHKADAHVFAFLVLHVDPALFACQRRQLRGHVQAAAPGQAGQDHRVIVRHVPRGKLHLHGLAAGAEVGGEDLIGDRHPGIAGHAQHGHAVFVQLPAVRLEVEAGQRGADVVVGVRPGFGVRFVVAAAHRVEVQRQVLRLGLHLDVGFAHRHADGLCGRAGFDGHGQGARILRTPGKGVLGAVHRLRGDLRAVDLDGHRRRQRHGIVHGERDVQRGILHRRGAVERADDDRHRGKRVYANHLIIQLIAAHGLAVDGRLEVHPEGVRTVRLLRNCEALLASRNAGGLRADLRAVQDEMHGFRDAAHGRVGEGDGPGVGRRSVEAAGEGNFHHRHRHVDGAVILVDVVHGQGHDVGPGFHIAGHVHRHVALLHLQRGLQHAVHAHRQGPVARGQIVLQACPVEGNRAGVAVRRDGLGHPAAGVVHGDVGVVAAVAAATAAASAAAHADHLEDHAPVRGEVALAGFLIHKAAVDPVQDLQLQSLNVAGVGFRLRGRLRRVVFGADGCLHGLGGQRVRALRDDHGAGRHLLRVGRCLRDLFQLGVLGGLHGGLRVLQGRFLQGVHVCPCRGHSRLLGRRDGRQGCVAGRLDVVHVGGCLIHGVRLGVCDGFQGVGLVHVHLVAQAGRCVTGRGRRRQRVGHQGVGPLQVFQGALDPVRGHRGRAVDLAVQRRLDPGAEKFGFLHRAALDGPHFSAASAGAGGVLGGDRPGDQAADAHRHVGHVQLALAGAHGHHHERAALKRHQPVVAVDLHGLRFVLALASQLHAVLVQVLHVDGAVFLIRFLKVHNLIVCHCVRLLLFSSRRRPPIAQIPALSGWPRCASAGWARSGFRAMSPA